MSSRGGRHCYGTRGDVSRCGATHGAGRASSAGPAGANLSRIARDLMHRLAGLGIEAGTLAGLVNDVAVARAEGINRDGLEAQVRFLLEVYGPGEIEALATVGRR